MQHERFISRLLNRPQLITPSAGAAVVAALMPGGKLDGYSGPVDSVDRDMRSYQVGNGMAIIPVIGELVHRGGMMSAMSGVTSYQGLGDMVTEALSDPAVSGLLLDIDSPGGEAAGCLDFAEWLSAQRGEKPIWAMVNQQASSAAYAIASAADRVLIGESGVAGSVGVVSYHTDISKALSNEGIKVTYIYAGDRKIDGTPALPLTDDARAAWQSEVDTLYSRFCSVVAANRGLSADAVRATEAAQFTGQDAIRAGLADQLSTYEDAIMQFSQRTAPAGVMLAAAVGSAAGARMAAADKPNTNPPPENVPAAPPPVQPKDQPAPLGHPFPGQDIGGRPGTDAPAHTEDGQPGALPVDAPDTRRPNPPASPGYLPADPVQVAEACAHAGFATMTARMLRGRYSMQDVQGQIEMAQEIAKAGQLTGQSSLAVAAIEEGLSLDSFRKLAFAAKEGGQAPISTAVPQAKPGAAQPAAKIDPTAIYARQREQQAANAKRAGQH